MDNVFCYVLVDLNLKQKSDYHYEKYTYEEIVMRKNIIGNFYTSIYFLKIKILHSFNSEIKLSTNNKFMLYKNWNWILYIKKCILDNRYLITYGWPVIWSGK